MTDQPSTANADTVAETPAGPSADTIPDCEDGTDSRDVDTLNDDRYLVVLDGKTSDAYTESMDPEGPWVYELERDDGEHCQARYFTCTAVERPENFPEAPTLTAPVFAFERAGHTYYAEEWAVDSILDLEALRSGGNAANELVAELNDVFSSEHTLHHSAF